MAVSGASCTVRSTASSVLLAIASVLVVMATLSACVKNCMRARKSVEFRARRRIAVG